MARSGGDGGSSGNGGVGYGRSMKEYEDQLSNLKKENFNLKLRIFFLEERMGVSSADKTESAVKTNIEMQVDIQLVCVKTYNRVSRQCQRLLNFMMNRKR